ncbi:hypothetical protein FGG08_002497 [Glutinoglossum americanum]|uniref:Uncharacterized protein n=1 Tax=Glutinoglossum americanum TaxID=1670608 RepID=A0A9P8KZ39_9PEZI|nr:hypothetical protein FGG08_002497 [Glutinoglossum americanum]
MVLSTVFNLALRVLRIVFAPWSATYGPIKSLLNAPSDPEKDYLTAAWRDRKLSELSFVGITCALMAGVISSSFSWQTVSQAPWSTTASWYGSLALDLAAICMATQQGVALNRLSCYVDGPARIRSLLGVPPAVATGTIYPRWSQLYVWQTPIMLLNFSIFFYTMGLAILVFDALIRGDRLDGEVKTAILFGTVGSFAALNYISCTFLLYKQSIPD